MSIMWTIAEQALRSQINAAPAQIATPPRFGMMAAAGLLCVAGIVFALAGIYMGLTMHFPPAVAALGTSGAAFGAAGIVVGMIHLRRHLHKRRLSRLPAAGNQMDAINDALLDIVEELEEPIKAYPKTAMALAALTGMVAGSRLN